MTYDGVALLVGLLVCAHYLGKIAEQQAKLAEQLKEIARRLPEPEKTEVLKPPFR
jgi:hypothetical protein